MATTPRGDQIDSLLAVGATALILLRHRSEPTVLALAYVPLLLFMCLTIQRVLIPEMRRPIQSLNAFLLFLALSLLSIAAPLTRDGSFRWAIPALSSLCSFAAGWEFVRRALGLRYTEPEGPEEVSKQVRKTFFAPSIVGGIICVVQIPIFKATESSSGVALAASAWLLPFALAWLNVRRFPRALALAHLQCPQAWDRVFGSPASFLVVVLAVCLIGVFVAFDTGQSNLLWLWALVSGIMFFQALIVVEVQL